MKKIKTMILISIFFVSFICISSSCKKTWICQEPYPYLMCVRGTDTIYNYGALANVNDYYYTATYIQNLVNYYTALGYTVYNKGSSTGISVNDKTTVESLEENGVTCIAQ